MGISGGKTTTKKENLATSETVAPSAYSSPYINDAAAKLRPAYDQSQSIMQRFLPQIDSAASYYGDVAGGKYLEGNPWLDKVIGSSNRDITDAVNSEMMPRFGSGMHTRVLADRLAQNENQLRYGNYATERGYQDQAAGHIPQLAAAATALPMVPAQGYSEAINSLLGRYMTSNGKQNGTTTTKESGGLLQSILGSVLGGVASRVGG